MSGRHYVLAITGASGAVYGLRLAEELLAAGHRLSLLISRPGFAVLKEECGLDWEGDAPEVTAKIRAYFSGSERVSYYAEDDFFSPIASGSFVTCGMAVAPCSIRTLAAVAYCGAHNLVARAADVVLKERRRLVLLVRETPLHRGHIAAMAAATGAGGSWPPIWSGSMMSTIGWAPADVAL